MVVEDLGSTNGTYLKRRAADRAQPPLHPGDRIRIGDSEFAFER
jgi:pSer/pThr/pTyr-binding forkhead associated (FHA) protein